MSEVKIGRERKRDRAPRQSTGGPGMSYELCRGCQNVGERTSWLHRALGTKAVEQAEECPPEWHNLQPVGIKWNFLRGSSGLLPPALPPSVPLRLVWLSVGLGLWWWVVQGYRCLSLVGQGPLAVAGFTGTPSDPPSRLHLSLSPQGEGLHQLREALKILAERVLILETMIGLYGE